MPFESWGDVWEFIKKNIPDVFVKRRFNFITIHYLYMMGMITLISVIMFGVGGMPYIDALFFASGACTQSGLNTIDVNLIHTGQQFALYMAAMLCNPIIIHSAVVFIRLYWFEKRFKDVVREARAIRRTKSRGRNDTFNKEDMEDARVEAGLRGRVINVLRNPGHSGRSDDQREAQDVSRSNSKVVESSDTSRKDSEEERNGKTTAAGADLPYDTSTDGLRVPLHMNPEQHIRFLESQRNPKDDTPLYIPSPREFDRGERPENIDREDQMALARQVTSDPEATRHTSDNKSPETPLGAPHITIDEPRMLRQRDKTSTYPQPNARHPFQTHRRETSREPSQLGTRRTNTFSTLRRSNTGKTMEPTPYLSYQPTIGRNSFFVNLTEEQREELGGIEYRALKTLAIVLMVYFFAIHILGAVCLIPWILKTSYGHIVTEQGQGRVWWGVFSAASAFNDLGFTLTNDSMISFGSAVFPMLLMTFLIVIGNTGFPCMLRFVIWLASKFVPVGSGIWEELHFLLDHPRRCFTLLFPRGATWWLFAILVVLNGLDLIFFIILDLHDPTVTSIPPGLRFVDGLFQASSTRTAGFSVVNLANLHPAIQVSYLVMMYISVFPIAISMRRTNVYEEKSLGIYASSEEMEADEKEPSYVGAHLRKQLSFDLWYVFLGMFIIAIVEGDRLQNTNMYAFTLFSVLFEIVSAYGTVGLSLGYPTINASFSAEFRTISKLVIIAMQIRGRHRGLPYELDRAILLPSETLQAKEQKEAERLMRRRRSSLGAQSAMSAVDGQIDNRPFRQETGLTSGHDSGSVAERVYSRERSNTNKTQTSMQHQAELHHSHARHGLGTAMFKLATAPDAIREEMGRSEKE